MVASEVATATCCAVSSKPSPIRRKYNTGTITAPPPIPKRPAASPAKSPAPIRLINSVQCSAISSMPSCDSHRDLLQAVCPSQQNDQAPNLRRTQIQSFKLPGNPCLCIVVKEWERGGKVPDTPSNTSRFSFSPDRAHIGKP